MEHKHNVHAAYRRIMENLPARLKEMAELAQIEYEQPEGEQVSLVRLDVMLSFFIRDAKLRQQRRARVLEP